MLSRAAERMAGAVASDRLTCVQGIALDAPAGPFDAATAFLALHFVPDDGARLAQLKAIHDRLKPGAPFLMINGMADPASVQVRDRPCALAASCRTQRR
ncbi:MAG: class I SAM-dependent methyltransferase [Nitrospira sp.]|nr:class I SAM-dependent methyltransferase [Nitrospira sp.]